LSLLAVVRALIAFCVVAMVSPLQTVKVDVERMRHCPLEELKQSPSWCWYMAVTCFAFIVWVLLHGTNAEMAKKTCGFDTLAFLSSSFRVWICSEYAEIVCVGFTHRQVLFLILWLMPTWIAQTYDSIQMPRRTKILQLSLVTVLFIVELVRLHFVNEFWTVAIEVWFFSLTIQL